MLYRRRRGATLGLVAIVALVVIVIGVAFFILVRMMGGGREVANTTDAGALNLAKKAMKVPVGPVPLEFSRLTQPENSEVTLLTYNRLVAQALLVALNAEAQQSGQANAAKTWAEVEKLGLKLREVLDDGPTTQSYFSEVASVNNTKMWGGAVFPETITQGFMRAGGSTNVWFDPNSFPVGGNLPANLFSTGNLKGTNNQPYMRGYEPISAAGLAIVGVPVFPGVKPHLVDAGELNGSSSPSSNVPPNSWKVQSRSQETKKTMLTGGALAAAIVGAVLQSDDVSQFGAAIPGGYIEFVNLPGKSGSFPRASHMNGSDSVFNNELYDGAIHVTNNVGGASTLEAIANLVQAIIRFLLGQDATDAGHVSLFNIGHACFSTDQSVIDAWIKFNKSADPNDPNHVDSPQAEGGRNANLDPDPSTRDQPNAFVNSDLRFGGDPGRRATRDQALQVVDTTDHCTCMDYERGASGPCANNLGAFVGNYSTKQTPGGGAINDFMNIEYAKASIIEQLLEGNWSATTPIPVPGGRSGLKKFDHGSGYPSGDNPVDFGQTGTILELLVQCDNGCLYSQGGTFDQIYQRCVQICPLVSRDEVRNLLNTTEIPIGKTMYLYRSSANKLVCNSSKPPTYSGQLPDGLPPDLDGCMTVRYNACQVNAQQDAYLHETPYLSGPSVTGVDRAIWRTSSGHQNLLGRCEFSNDAEGGGTYSHPN